MDLGFSRSHAVKALRATDGLVERAADWVFNHPDEPDTEMPAADDNSRMSDKRFSKYLGDKG